MHRTSPPQARAGRAHARLLVLGGLIALAVLAWALAGSQPRPGAHGASLERGLREFHEISVTNGRLHATKRRAHRGKRSAQARYNGGGGNGYARAQFHTNWRGGDRVLYRAAFFLPRGFHRAMQGQVALMRWDNWPSHGSGGDQGGIVINGSDRRARLVSGRYSGQQRQLGRPFKLPEGRWFTLAVRQRLSQSRPRSVVRLRGRKVISTRERNFNGRRIERMRFGLVAIAAGKQRRPLSLFFDDVVARKLR